MTRVKTRKTQREQIETVISPSPDLDGASKYFAKGHKKQKPPLQFLSEGYTVAVSRRLTNMLEMDSRTASRFWLVKAKELTEFV